MYPKLFYIHKTWKYDQFSKKRKSINAKPKMTPTLELSVKPYRAAILTIITMLHEVKINTLVIDGKIDILSRELETIEKNE